jgi:hypothetical protein
VEADVDDGGCSASSGVGECDVLGCAVGSGDEPDISSPAGEREVEAGVLVAAFELRMSDGVTSCACPASDCSKSMRRWDGSGSIRTPSSSSSLADAPLPSALPASAS